MSATVPTFLPGLVSVSFRKMSAKEIIALVAKAQLAGIEWGGDIHVPHGEIGTAREVGQRTREAGLTAAAYGSYYRVGTPGPDGFKQIVDTAIALGTKVIRVWPGGVGSAEASDDLRRVIADDARRCANLASDAGLTLACEWHGGTLTDTAESGQALLDAINHPAFKTYWQPRTKLPFATSLADMDAALPRLAGVHAFHWDESGDRRPLVEGATQWRAYLDKLATAPGGTAGQYILLEFIRNEDPQQFLLDAATLKSWL